MLKMSVWTCVTLHCVITLGVNFCCATTGSGITVENFKAFSSANSGTAMPPGGRFQYLKVYAKSRLHCLMACTHYQACLSVIFNQEDGECKLFYGAGPVESTLLHVFPLMYTKLSRLQDDRNTNSVTSTIPNTSNNGTSNFNIVRPECKSYGSAEIKSIKLNQSSTQLKVRCSAWGLAIQENDDDDTDVFNQKLSKFQSGIGDVNDIGEKYMMSLDDIHLLTSSMAFSLAISPHNGDIFQLFDFRMANSSMNYRITFSRCSVITLFPKECQQSMLNLNGTMFSTFDADHDADSTKNCAYEAGGGFWYSTDCNDWDFHWWDDGYLSTKRIRSLLLVFE